ncbi:MAG TPA: O-antigen ligase family protein [Gaiellaceae bacterium]
MAHEARPGQARLNAVEPAERVAPAAARSRPLAGAAFTIPPVILLGLGLLLAFRGGGIIPEDWAPVTVGTSIGLAVLAAVGSVPAVPRSAWPALGALFAFVAWNACSLAWSASPDATVESVARLALLFLAAIVGASYAARVSSARAVGIALALAGAVLALTVEVKLLAGSTAIFANTRLSWPIDYANGSAGLLFLGVPPLLAGAAADRIRPLGRALVAALAALALSQGLMTLSRGAAIALVATLAVCVALATARGRFALTLAAVALPVALLAGRITGGRPGEVASDATSRGWAAAVAMGAAAVVVALLASVEQSSRVTAKHRGVAAIAVWACIGIVGVAAFSVHYGRPDTWISARWHEFSHPEQARTADASRFGNATSNRYDYWRVAAHTFEAHPLGGTGSGAFAVPWFRHRAINESVTDAHSWEAASLSETGLVGFLLLAAALLLPLVQIARARRAVGSFAAVSLGGAAAYFVLHGSLEWLLLIPAFVLPAGVAIGACAATGGEPTVRLAPGRHRAALAVGAILLAVAAIPVYLATTLTERGEQQSVSSTQRAVNTLSLAARINPWSVEPLILKSEILLEAGRKAEAVEPAAKATRRDPNLWTAWEALAEAERAAGNRTAAAAASRRVRTLNPLHAS